MRPSPINAVVFVTARRYADTMIRSLFPLAAAAMIAAFPASAQLAAAPLSTHGLPAPGEVILRVSGTGTTRSRPDIATFQIVVQGGGDTDTAARDDARQRIGRLRTALAAAGISPDALRLLSNVVMPTGFIGNEALLDIEADMAPNLRAARATKMAVSIAQIGIENIDKLPALRRVVDADEHIQVSQTIFSLRDDAQARRTAIAAAVARARAEADAYATALDMRIVRIVRVASDAPQSIDESARMLNAMYRAMGSGGGGGGGDDVEISACATIEMVLAPR